MTKKFVVVAVALAGYMAMIHSAYAATIVDGWAAPTQAHRIGDVAGPVAKHYSALWHACAERAGCQPGRNIRREGVKTKDGTRPARKVDLLRSSVTLDRWLHPAPAPVSTTLSTPAQATVSATPVAASSGGMPSCTWAPESGGSYTAVNPSSGAYGKYQIIPSTWAAHCSGISKDPAGQETCARRVMAAQGAGAWVNC